MKSEWKIAPLRDLVGYIAKGIPPAYTEIESATTIRVLNQKCNRNLTISYTPSRLHDTSKRRVPQEKLLVNDDILINATGTGTAGRVAQIHDVPCQTTVDGHMIILRAKKDMVPRYLGYAIKAHQSEILRLDEGSTGQTELNRERLLSEILIDYPTSVIEQQGIADLLFALDARIANNADINHHLEMMAQAIFKSWFIDFEPWDGIMPDDWREGTFSDIVSGTLGGDWGKDAPIGNNTQEVYCIRGADIPDVNIGNKGKMPIRYIIPKNYCAKKLAIGDIVVEISGGSPTQSTGRCAIITQSLLNRYDRGMVCTNFCRAIKPLAGYSSFVYYYWKYLYDQNVMFSYENGTTGIKNFDISGFLEIERIFIPPKGFASQFAESVEVLIDTIFANGHENERLAYIRDTLLPCLISGKLPPPCRLRRLSPLQEGGSAGRASLLEGGGA